MYQSPGEFVALAAPCALRNDLYAIAKEFGSFSHKVQN